MVNTRMGLNANQINNMYDTDNDGLDKNELHKYLSDMGYADAIVKDRDDEYIIKFNGQQIVITDDNNNNMIDGTDLVSVFDRPSSWYRDDEGQIVRDEEDGIISQGELAFFLEGRPQVNDITPPLTTSGVLQGLEASHDPGDILSYRTHLRIKMLEISEQF